MKYHSMNQLAKECKFLAKDIENWHLVEPQDGVISGIEDRLFGTLVAQNGNLGLMERGNELILVHANNFVPDKKYQVKVQPKREAQKPARVAKNEVVVFNIEQYLLNLGV